MKGLYARLAAVGLPKKYVQQRLLPDWWDDAVADNPVGYTEALWTIARHLGVPADHLRDTSKPLALPRENGVQFKLTKGVAEKDVDLARLLGEQAAKFALLGVDQEPLPSDPLEVRSRILGTGAQRVDFASLVDFCWSVGVPVLHVVNLPESSRKMEGMAVRIGDKSAIVLASNRSRSWLLFHLAHELGHLALGHVQDGGAVVDGKIEQDSVEPEEAAANEFALVLITGQREPLVQPGAPPLPPPQLAKRATRFESIDTGHYVLNYANSVARTDPKYWGVANLALQLLGSEDGAQELMHERLGARLDWSRLPNEAAAFVRRMAVVP